MNKISSEVVEKTWQRMSESSDDDVAEIMNDLSQQQPLILAYLLAAGHENLNQDERELLIYLGIVVWKMMSQGDSPLPTITEDKLHIIEDKNMKMLEYLEEESQTGFEETVATSLSGYNQTEILRYVTEALFEEEDDEEVEVREYLKGNLMVYLKVVIDCFDQ